MFASEVQIIAISNKDKTTTTTTRRESSPKIKSNLNKSTHHLSQKSHNNIHLNNGNNGNNRKKLYNNYNAHPNNNANNTYHRKKFYQQNNNNTTIKNQNIACLTTNTTTTNVNNIVKTSIIYNNSSANAINNNNNQKSSTLKQASTATTVTTNNNKDTNLKTPLQLSMVMNSNLNPNQKITDATTTASTSSANLTSPASQSAPVSPNSSYSLDFLHSVGVQMTAGHTTVTHTSAGCSSSNGGGGGGSNSYNSPSISPSRQHGNINNNYSLNFPPRHRYNQENSPILIADNHFMGGSRGSYKEIPILIHHPFGRSMVSSPLSSEGFVAFHHHQQQQQQHHHHSQHHQQQQQNHSGYHFNNNNNFPNQYHHNPYHNMNGGGGYNNNNNNHRNSSHQSKKQWWSQNRKNYTNNNNNTNAGKNNTKNPNSTAVSTSSTATSSTVTRSSGNNECVSTSTSNTLPRTKHQNSNNLTYVTSDSISYVSPHHHSRSSTPSPKSESPSLMYKKIRQQHQYTQKHQHQSNSIDPKREKDNCASSPYRDEGFTAGHHHFMNGYDSDSSHSSSYNCNGNTEFDSTATNLTMMGGYNNNQIAEVTSLVNFPTYSEDDLVSNQISYIGSQPNLYWSHIGYHHSNYGIFQPVFANNSTSPTSTSGDQNDHMVAVSADNMKRGNINPRLATSSRGRNRNVYSGNVRMHIVAADHFLTPPDRYLAKAHLIEVKESPPTLLNGSKWDQLSQDIWNKFLSSQQTEETYRRKIMLWRILYIMVKNSNPRFGLYLVGSTMSGFGADTSDCDMCLVTRAISNLEPRIEALINLNALRDTLTKSGKTNQFDDFKLIEAKVPILRFRDKVNMLQVDLNFNNCVGIKNTYLLHCYSQLDWRLRPLVIITKLWAQFHDINNAKNMTISSYSLVLMVIHFLQYAVSPPILPCLHDMFPEKFTIIKCNDVGHVDLNECMAPYETQNTQTLGELFLQFLNYYSNFDYAQYAISIRTGSLIPIEICRQTKSNKNEMHQWKELCIEEPFDLTNTARSVYDGETFERVKAVFVSSYNTLQETFDLSSIFSPIVQGTTLSPPEQHTTIS